jgi:hypothetical protein
VSTSYYLPRAPITSLRADVGGGHTHLGVWVHHAKSGTLVLRNEEMTLFLEMLEGREVMHVHFGGVGVGVIITGGEDLDPDQVLISEYSELTTVEDVRRLKGAGA